MGARRVRPLWPFFARVFLGGRLFSSTQLPLSVRADKGTAPVSLAGTTARVRLLAQAQRPAPTGVVLYFDPGVLFSVVALAEK